ncbi:Transcription factor [Sesamum angolense]|uniref:Transcription factor n=1 Tax=Sesamum angolense TaxID=2727404 RepID=A0AAE2C2K8_9LAMI|nr:Transcription factor [Sesamum angolense]
MVEPLSISNPDTNSSPSGKKRRKSRRESAARTPAEPCGARWRTETEQQVYSAKLADALRHLRFPDSADSSVRSVRDAADQVLAVSAKGRTRWSRAMLTSRLGRRLAQISRKHKKAARPDGRFKKPAAQKKLPPLQRKVRALSRLIPGCQKLSLPNLLEETTDYIAALEMQVKAMAFLAGLLNGANSDGGGGGGGSVADGGQYSSSS